MRAALLILLLILVTGATSYAQGPEPVCPTFKVIGPAGITPAGNDLYFDLKFDDGFDSRSLEVTWSVENGELFEGQGTSKIRVVSGIPGSVVVAKVTIRGLPVGCSNEASESGPISYALPSCPLDEWGTLPPEDELGRLDTFFAELLNNPNQVGFMVLYVGENGKREEALERISRVIKHAKFRKFDKSRLEFGIAKTGVKRTVLYRIPENGDLPSCDDCEILKGRFQWK